MGIRLYPNTTDPRKLEVLSQVSEGTYEKLMALEAKYNFGNPSGDFFTYQTRMEQFHEEVSANNDLNNLHGFLLFGWGKFNGFGIAKDCSGSLQDRQQCETLLKQNDIQADVDLCEGLHWC